MIFLRRAARFLPILILLFIFQACAQTKNGPPPETTAQTQMPTKPRVISGDHQKLIDYYKAEHKNHPDDQSLVKEYVKNLKEIKAAADKAAQREDFTNAGKAYRVLLKNYPDFRGFAHSLSFDKAQLTANLATCKTVLSRRGFEEYREGNLSEAISQWQGYLAIDPHNADIKKALNTARAQQKNLQQTK